MKAMHTLYLGLAIVLMSFSGTSAMAIGPATTVPDQGEIAAADSGGTKEGVLVAWASPLFGTIRFADHTWVTTYEKATACSPPNEDYWYCTGGCRDTTAPSTVARELGLWRADLQLARCIAQPNSQTFAAGPPTARIRYLKDGVCHQIANRILYAASDEGVAPTVEGARGYGVTVFFFGKYGTSSQWRQLLQDCSADRHEAVSEHKALSEREAFAAWLDTRLVSEPEKETQGETEAEKARRKERLVELREAVIERWEVVLERKAELDREFFTRSTTEALPPEKRAMDAEERARQYAESVNELATSSIRDMLPLLGRELYERVFDISADEEKIVVGDPAIAAEVYRDMSPDESEGRPEETR
jgi:hypothetical protein